MARQSVRLTDGRWPKLALLLSRLPTSRAGGRPWVDNRAVLNGIPWMLKTGARWRDLPERYPSPSTCWRRLRRWATMGPGSGSGGASSRSWTLSSSRCTE